MKIQVFYRLRIYLTDYRVAFDYGPIGQDNNDSGTLDILEEIDKLSASGTTLLWKSTYVGLEMAIENNHDYVSMGLLVFTDGEDNQSGNTDEYWVEKISEKAKNEGIPIFTVGLDQEGWAYNPEPLEELAERTGGMFFDTPDSEELEKIYEELFEVTEKRAVEGFL